LLPEVAKTSEQRIHFPRKIALHGKKLDTIDITIQ
jgi:hypothetical protein